MKEAIDPSPTDLPVWRQWYHALTRVAGDGQSDMEPDTLKAEDGTLVPSFKTGHLPWRDAGLTLALHKMDDEALALKLPGHPSDKSRPRRVRQEVLGPPAPKRLPRALYDTGFLRGLLELDRLALDIDDRPFEWSRIMYEPQAGASTMIVD